MCSNESQWRELGRLFGQLTPVMYPSPSPGAKIIPLLPVGSEGLSFQAAPMEQWIQDVLEPNPGAVRDALTDILERSRVKVMLLLPALLC